MTLEQYYFMLLTCALTALPTQWKSNLLQEELFLYETQHHLLII